MNNALKQCAKCGACTVVCPAYRAGKRESLSARGRLHLLASLEPAKASEAYAQILSKCLLCGACRSACSRSLDPPALFIDARTSLHRTVGSHAFLRTITQKALASPGLLKSLAAIGLPLLQRLPAESGLRLRLGLSPPFPQSPGEAPLPAQSAKHSLSYFAGCYASHVRKDIAAATEKIAIAAGETVFTPHRQCCCGLAAESAGDIDTAKQLARRNIEAFSENNLPILTSCASCYSSLSRYPQLFQDDPDWLPKAQAFAGRLLEFSTFVAAAMQASPALSFSAFGQERTVAYHDPCHLRFHIRITTPPRTILRNIPGLNLQELPDGPHCCGQGGLFHLAQPELAAEIRRSLLAQIAQTNAKIITTTCTGCLLHIGTGLSGSEEDRGAQHLALLLAALL